MVSWSAPSLSLLPRRAMSSMAFEEDPLTLAMAPPPDETAEQRLVREAEEERSKRRSDEIDDQLRKERDAEKKKKNVKLLLLGQSESGKTATLKNFQLTYARREWKEERLLWRSVIVFNLVRNVNDVLDELSAQMAILAPRSSEESSTSDDSSDDGSSHRRFSNARSGSPIKFKEKHRLLKQRLSPLRSIQTDLERTLGHAAIELKSTDVMTAAPFGKREFSIHATNGWKSAFDKLKSLRGRQELRQISDAEEDILDVVASCAADIKALWMDSTVKEMLSRRKPRLEDSPGFFLDDVERIASRDYTPTDDHIIRSRLRTLGVQEYRFVFDHGRTVGQEWRLYDVGGTRSSRAAWYPYFDDVDAIIFLAPISCFDEKLAEDRRVNRLEDSFLLWKSVVSCKLLSRTQIILFLNKCDLLQAKLTRGVKIRDSVPSYADRANNLSTATKYFQQHFREISRQSSPVQRPFYVHLTSVIDTRSTAVTLAAVEESILRDHLRRADLM